MFVFLDRAHQSEHLEGVLKVNCVVPLDRTGKIQDVKLSSKQSSWFGFQVSASRNETGPFRSYQVRPISTVQGLQSNDRLCLSKSNRPLL